ncbi:hypothetical protein [uncultured Winogradskyella sp.]|uniref:hypothetical protein n=1 Tax=uncultured Winogradskyella sp. TaxID=395353 RepID=UPI0035130D52
MKQSEEDFELVKEPSDEKRNYIFKKDKITLGGFFFVLAVLILLIAAVVLTYRYLG